MSQKINSLSVNRDSHNRGISQNRNFSSERSEKVKLSRNLPHDYWNGELELVGCCVCTAEGSFKQNRCDECLFAALDIPCLLDLNEEYFPILERAGIELPF